MFVYERYPHGLGFTEQAFEILGDVILAMQDTIIKCGCRNGCPCCVGKPLRGYTTWNIERGEANIPSKRAALRILRDIIGDGSSLPAQDREAAVADDDQRRLLLERGIRRRLERLGDPEVFHPIDPRPEVGFPDVERPAVGTGSDVARRAFKRLLFERLKAVEQAKAPEPMEISRPARDLEAKTDPDFAHEAAPKEKRSESKALRNMMRKNPASAEAPAPAAPQAEENDKEASQNPIKLGDSVAARARRLKKEKG